MELEAAIRARHSVRAYLSEPVSREVVRSLLEMARWAPNGADQQTWRVSIVEGPALEAWRAAMSAGALEQPWAKEDIEAFDEMARGVGWGQVEAVVGTPYDVMRLGSMRFYGAPAAVVVSEIARPGAGWRDPDGLAAFVMLFMLAACQAGLGACWLGFVTGQPDLLRQHARLPAEEQAVAVLSLGYPNMSAPINALRTPRESPDAWARWVN